MNGDVPIVTKKLVGHVDNSRDPADHRRYSVDAEHAGECAGSGAGDDGVRLERGSAGRAHEAFSASADDRLPAGPTWQQQVLAKGWGYAELVPTSVQADNGAGLTQGIIGLVEQGPAAQAGRLGRAARLGVGREPRAGLFRDRQSRGRQAGGHRGALAIRQGRAGGNGVRPRFAIALHQFVGRRRREAPSPEFRRAGGKRRGDAANIIGWRAIS